MNPHQYNQLTDKAGQTIAIFGGTFSPPHKAHMAIANTVIKNNMVDKVLFIPSAIPPHKEESSIIPFHHRYNMLKLLLEGSPHFLISDIEFQRMPNPSYTIATVKELQQHYPKTTFLLLIGGDSLAQLHTWYEARALAECCGLIVYPRPDTIISQNELEKNWKPSTVRGFLNNVIEVPQLNISSTEIRKKLKNNEKLANVLDKRVINYIIEHKIYTTDSVEIK